MFSIGDLVVYGGEGVCRVEGVGPAAIPGADKEKLYYHLAPLSRSGQVLTPVDTRVLIRTVMSAGEARSLVAQLPELEPEEPPVVVPPEVPPLVPGVPTPLASFSALLLRRS